MEAKIPVRKATAHIVYQAVISPYFINIRTPAIIMSAPKMRFSRLFESFFMSIAPIAAPARPSGMNFTAWEKSRLPPLKYTSPLIIDNGSVIAIDVA